MVNGKKKRPSSTLHFLDTYVRLIGIDYCCAYSQQASLTYKWGKTKQSHSKSFRIKKNVCQLSKCKCKGDWQYRVWPVEGSICLLNPDRRGMGQSTPFLSSLFEASYTHNWRSVAWEKSWVTIGSHCWEHCDDSGGKSVAERWAFMIPSAFFFVSGPLLVLHWKLCFWDPVPTFVLNLYEIQLNKIIFMEVLDTLLFTLLVNSAGHSDAWNMQPNWWSGPLVAFCLQLKIEVGCGGRGPEGFFFLIACS